MNEGSSVAKTPASSLTWQRLRYSPLRDVLRGRLTGRLNIKRRIAEADLPQSLKTLVQNVIRATHLTRLERVDVADELLVHFLDGLEAGADPAQLAKTFGEARTAGRLMGRAKKRIRPLWWQALVRSAQIVSLVLGVSIALYIVAAAQFFLSKPNIAVDYREQLNANARAVPEADRAWPHYRAALLAMPDLPSFKGEANRDPHPGEPGWETIETYLATNSETIATLRTAGTLPGLGFVTGYEFSAEDQELWPDLEFSESDIERSGLYAILLPYLSEIRTLATTLQWDARRAMAAGEVDVALADLQAMLGMTRQVREAPFIINDLVALAVFRRTLQTLGELIADYPEGFDEAQLQQLAHRLSAHGESQLRVRIEGERMGFADIVQRSYSDDGEGDGYLTAQGCTLLLYAVGAHTPDMSEATIMFAGPALRNVMLSRRELLMELDAYLDGLAVYAATPLWTREPAPVEMELEKWNTSLYSRAKHFPLIVLMPALSKASLSTDIALQHREAILTAIALRLYERRHGQWPDSLEALTPGLLPETPVDFFDGQTLRYILRDGRPLLYSVGADRDDDDGTANSESNKWKPASFVTAVKTGRSTEYLPDGDWVLWPQPIEPFLDYSKASPVDE